MKTQALDLVNHSAVRSNYMAAKKSKTSQSTSSTAPRVFVSYTHESKENKAWVLKLATDLRKYGVDVILTFGSARTAANLPFSWNMAFATPSVYSWSGTPTYQRKANAATGGVRYECLVVTAEMATNIKTEKFICVLRQGDQDFAIPVFARSRLFIDFRNDADYEERLLELLRDIHLAPLIPSLQWELVRFKNRQVNPNERC